jgi:putative ABC transport system permease protein
MLFLSVRGFYGSQDRAIHSRISMRKDVLLMVFRSAAMSVAGGVLTGVLLTIALRRVLAHSIQGSSLNVPILLGVVILLLVVTSGLSCLIPARRASSVDPVVALRCEYG